MAFLLSHLVTYAAVSGLLTAVWLLTGGGSTDDLARIFTQDVALAGELDFWPIWVILGWGTGVVIHAGIFVSRRLFSRRYVQRRRRVAKEAIKAGRRIAQDVAELRGASGGPPRRHWVTVMFADLADSTSLAERLGDAEYSRLVVAYRDTIRKVVKARGGQEVGTQGDGFLARFPTPAEAVLGAVDVQRELADAAASVRIGVHAGEAVQEDGDLIGRMINLASRVTEKAEPGEILVTEPVADYVGERLTLEDRGLCDLKGVSAPRHLLSVRWADA